MLGCASLLSLIHVFSSSFGTPQAMLFVRSASVQPTPPRPFGPVKAAGSEKAPSHTMGVSSEDPIAGAMAAVSTGPSGAASGGGSFGGVTGSSELHAKKPPRAAAQSIIPHRAVLSMTS